MRRFVPVVLSSVALLAFGACGDDEERLSQEEFVEEANGLCEAGSERVEAAFEEAFPDESVIPEADEVEEAIDDIIIPAFVQLIEELRDLNPPEDVEDEFNELLDDAESASEEFGELSGEEILASDENSEDDPFADVNAGFEELGLDTCADV